MVMELVGLSEAGGIPGRLFFAREPDTDFVLEELDAPDRTRQGPAGAPQKPPRSNTIVLLILLLIVAIGAYFAMNPEFVMSLLGQEPVPVRVPGQAQGGARTTAPSGTQRPGSDSVVTQPPSVSDMVPSPLFGEGEHAVVNGLSASPGSPIALSVDSTGAERGHSVRPGEVVTVIDAEWLGNRWVYLVRTQDGAHGWISEKQLTAAL
jgi:hypothetical protein